MPRSDRFGSLVWVIALSLGVAGCSRPPERVSVSLSGVTGNRQVQVEGVGVQMAGFGGSKAELTAWDELRLYQGTSDTDVQRIEAVLKQSRQMAFERALASLRKQYLSQVDAEVAVARSSVDEADASDWEETSSRLREVFDKYLDKEGHLRAKIASLFVPRNKRPPVIDLSSELAAQLHEPVTEAVRQARADLAEWDAQFQAEIAPVISDYLARKANRDGVPASLEKELTAKFEEDAQREAKTIVETTFKSAENFGTVMKETVPPVPAESVSSAGVAGGRSDLEGKAAVVPEDLKKEAEIFASSRGYQLVSAGRGVRDATEEFLKWRKNYTIGR